MKLFARKSAAILTALAILFGLAGAAFWLLHGVAPEAELWRVLGRIETQSTQPTGEKKIQP